MSSTTKQFSSMLALVLMLVASSSWCQSLHLRASNSFDNTDFDDLAQTPHVSHKRCVSGRDCAPDQCSVIGKFPSAMSLTAQWLLGKKVLWSKWNCYKSNQITHYHNLINHFNSLTTQNRHAKVLGAKVRAHGRCWIALSHGRRARQQDPLFPKHDHEVWGCLHAILSMRRGTCLPWGRMQKATGDPTTSPTTTTTVRLQATQIALPLGSGKISLNIDQMIIMISNNNHNQNKQHDRAVTLTIHPLYIIVASSPFD